MKTWDDWIHEMTKSDSLFEEGLKKAEWINKMDVFGETALMKAANNSKVSLKKLKALIQAGAQVNQVEKGMECSMALIRACTKGYTKKVKVLIEAGAKVNQRDPYNRFGYPLLSACENGDHEMVKDLIEAGADTHVQSTLGGVYQKTLLNKKSDSEILKIFKVLDQYQAPLKKDWDGKNIWMNLIMLKKPTEYLDFFREKIQDLEERDSKGATVLMLAAEYGTTETIEYLLKSGANVHQHDHQDFSVLHYAVKRCQEALILKCLKEGVNVNHLNQDGETALMVGCRFLPLNLIQLLVEHHSDLTLRNKKNQTALNIAVEQNRLNVVNFLKSASDQLLLQQCVKRSPNDRGEKEVQVEKEEFDIPKKPFRL